MKSFYVFLFLFAYIYHTNGQFCGNKKFNPTFEICCQGVVHSSFGGKKCCGLNTYSPTFNQCCYGAILSKSFINTHCCGPRQYNPTFQTCCFGRIYSKIDVKYCMDYGGFNQNY